MLADVKCSVDTALFFLYLCLRIMILGKKEIRSRQ